MKYPLPSTAYSFNAAAKTITFIGTVPAEIGNILQVANVTRGVLYFQPQAGITFSGSYASPTLTLTADTTGHSNSDKLLIIYDNGADGATAAKQDTGNSSLASIDGKTPALNSGRVPVDGSGVTQPVSAASLPLPSGAATAANQTTANTSLAAIAGLSIPAHDWIGLTYTGTNLTGVQYRTGGASGTIVGTLTLAYSGSNLTSVTKS